MTSDQIALEVPADVLDEMEAAFRSVTPQGVVRASSSSSLRVGGFGEILIAGHAVLVAVLPVVAFYLGRGRRMTIRVGETVIDANGYQVDDVLRVIDAIRAAEAIEASPPATDGRLPALGPPRTKDEILAGAPPEPILVDPPESG